MGFYYFSILSFVPLGIAYGVSLLLFWGVARVTRGMPGRKALLGVVGAVFLILPVAEELWIAWNFGQACKEAGTFIQKKVKVDGFYDDTHSWSSRRMVESLEPRYQFVEGRGSVSGKTAYWRHERLKDQIRTFRIDHPTARYHYKQPYSHSPVAHKIVKHERIVADGKTNEVIARELSYGRSPSWFHIGLGSQILCYGKRDVKGSLYATVLIPHVNGVGVIFD